MSKRLINLQVKVLQLKLDRLKILYEKQKRRNAFVKKHRRRILSLKMDGWPKTRNMKDYIKWLELIYEAKVEGIYSFNTANCDIIANLRRFAKQHTEKSDI